MNTAWEYDTAMCVYHSVLQLDFTFTPDVVLMSTNFEVLVLPGVMVSHAVI